MCSDGMLEEMEDRELVNILSLPQSDLKKIGILKGATINNNDNHSAFLIHILSKGNDNQELTENDSKTISRRKTAMFSRPLFWFIAITISTIIVLLSIYLFR